MKIFSWILFICLISLINLPTALAHAEEVQRQGVFSHWQTYSLAEGQDKICYIIAKPISKQPENVRHGDIYFLIASWKSGIATEQPIFITNYPLHNNPPPVASVGSARVPMYIGETTAYIENRKDERRLIRYMRAGSVMRVKARSKRGTSVNYEFSLKGVTAALEKAKDVCQ